MPWNLKRSVSGAIDLDPDSAQATEEPVKFASSRCQGQSALSDQLSDARAWKASAASARPGDAHEESSPGAASSSSQARAEESIAAAALLCASRIIVLTGAGVSAESGVPTFRGNEGSSYWAAGSEEGRPEDLATWAKFNVAPSRMWSWWRRRWRLCEAAQPNSSHFAIVELEGLVQGNLTVVTQNIDGLHVKAGSNPDGIHEIHGSLAKIRCDDKLDGACANGLNFRMSRNFDTVRSTLGNMPALTARDGNPKASSESLCQEDCESPPVCSKCGKRMRPHVLWFDEQYNEALYGCESVLEAAKACDLLLVVGTTLSTSLPLLMVKTALEAGAAAIRIDSTVNSGDFSMFDKFLSIVGQSGAVLPRIISRMRELQERLGSASDCLTRLVEEHHGLLEDSVHGRLAVLGVLPEDLPADRAAQVEIRKKKCKNPTRCFRFTQEGQASFEVAVAIRAASSRVACDRILRACYLQLASGASKDDVSKFRDVCCQRIWAAICRILGNVSNVSVGAGHDARESSNSEPDAKTQQSTEAEAALVDGSQVPEDSPSEDFTYHEVGRARHFACRFSSGAGPPTVFHVSVAGAGSKEAAEHISRLCLARLRQGWGRKETVAYRDNLYRMASACRLPSLLAQATAAAGTAASAKRQRLQGNTRVMKVSEPS